MRSFWVADLSAGGEILLTERYENALLEQIPGAAELIGEFSGRLYRSPEGFLVELLDNTVRVEWRACCPTGGVVSVRFREPTPSAHEPWQLATFALLLSGIDEEDDRAICQAAQNRLVEVLRGTGFEPAFDLAGLAERPAVASFSGTLPADPSRRAVLALSDRCFGAAYFRLLRLV